MPGVEQLTIMWCGLLVGATLMRGLLSRLDVACVRMLECSSKPRNFGLVILIGLYRLVMLSWVMRLVVIVWGGCFLAPVRCSVVPSRKRLNRGPAVGCSLGLTLVVVLMCESSSEVRESTGATPL